MPELPEIETLRRSLLELSGKQITKIRFSALAPIETTSSTKIRQAMVSSTLESMERQGKYLLLKNTSQQALVIHLGMSGQLRFFPSSSASKEKHTHMQILFSDGSQLHYRDARRFGTLSLTQRIDHQDNPFLAKLGPDYLHPQLNPKIYLERCRRHPKISLKTLTLHQGIACGLGNIYACESLYRARLDPRRKIQDTRDEELERLLKAAQETLQEGIEYGGVSMRDYLDGKGHRGIMKKFLRVYDREGEPALDGVGKVQRMVQNNRSTWFVPQVQK